MNTVKELITAKAIRNVFSDYKDAIVYRRKMVLEGLVPDYDYARWESDLVKNEEIRIERQLKLEVLC